MDTNEKTNKALEALQERIDDQQEDVDSMALDYNRARARLEAMKESRDIMKEALDS